MLLLLRVSREELRWKSRRFRKASHSHTEASKKDWRKKIKVIPSSRRRARRAGRRNKATPGRVAGIRQASRQQSLSTIPSNRWPQKESRPTPARRELGNGEPKTPAPPKPPKPPLRHGSITSIPEINQQLSCPSLSCPKPAYRLFRMAKPFVKKAVVVKKIATLKSLITGLTYHQHEENLVNYVGF
jgi:hypothetical protein